MKYILWLFPVMWLAAFLACQFLPIQDQAALAVMLFVTYPAFIVLLGLAIIIFYLESV
jgi:hypothetical protein